MSTTKEKRKFIAEVQAKATCIYTRQEIEAALDRLAVKLKNEVGRETPIFMCVLLGGIIPLGNLLPRLDFPLEVDYAHASRYQGRTHGAELSWKAKPRLNLKDRTIVIVDDILDEGITLAVLRDYCIAQGAKKVYTAVLLDKKRKRDDAGLQQADFVGLGVDNVFVVGYGLDYDEYLRNMPGIYAVAPEHQ
jgi:hypoxanthine phosphoribosyltransferase